MTPWQPEKKDVLAALADDILHNYGKGRTLVAVDGDDTARTAAFADDLAAAMRLKGHAVFRASIEGFHRPRAERHARGADSPEGRYSDSYDYSTFQRTLIQPFRLGGSTGFVAAAFDVERDAAVEPVWLTGPADALLIVDGTFLNRPELRGLWNYSVWLEASEKRPEASDEGEARAEAGAQALYAAEAKPRTAATAIVDNTDADHPRRRFADSC
jgi:uridine kinase